MIRLALPKGMVLIQSNFWSGKEKSPQNYGQILGGRQAQSPVVSRFRKSGVDRYIEIVDWAVIPPAMAHVVPEMAN